VLCLFDQAIDVFIRQACSYDAGTRFLAARQPFLSGRYEQRHPFLGADTPAAKLASPAVISTISGNGPIAMHPMRSHAGQRTE
jgi:hypothetical protein